jgi:hypothetical protein
MVGVSIIVTAGYLPALVSHYNPEGYLKPPRDYNFKRK